MFFQTIASKTFANMTCFLSSPGINLFSPNLTFNTYLAGWTKFSSVWICNLCFIDCCQSIQISASGYFVILRGVMILSAFFLFSQDDWYKELLGSELLRLLLFYTSVVNQHKDNSDDLQRKVEFYEPAALHGSYSSDGLTSCNIVYGGKRGWDHNRSCQKGYQNFLVSASQFFSGIFCEPD